tara:strand:- start:784 stop:975 length:192 start_codon:yes stop_codon:yes gene_type:complete
MQITNMNAHATPTQDKRNTDGSLQMVHAKKSAAATNMVTPPGLFSVGKLPEGTWNAILLIAFQ